MSTNKIIAELDAEQMSRELPDFAPGDTLVVQVKVKEGNRERLQAFEGVCIGKRNRGLNSAFTVRKISHGVGVERTFRPTARWWTVSTSNDGAMSDRRSFTTCANCLVKRRGSRKSSPPEEQRRFAGATGPQHHWQGLFAPLRAILYTPDVCLRCELGLNPQRRKRCYRGAAELGCH